MPYPAITSRRIPYDIDGTVVGYRVDGLNPQYSSGITTWASSTQLGQLNDSDNTPGSVLRGLGDNWGHGWCVWFFFPEKKEIEQIVVSWSTEDSEEVWGELQGSNDTTNGTDGTWETAVLSNGNPPSHKQKELGWSRNYIKPVSFSTSYKVIRFRCWGNTGYTASNDGIWAVHLYGRKADGENPDDILFCDSITGNEITTVLDWGDRPEGTTLINSFKLKNSSTTKIATGVNLQLNHSDFLLSFDQISWAATLDISNIPVNSLTSEIFIKNVLGPPLLTLGPKDARIIVTIQEFI